MRNQHDDGRLAPSFGGFPGSMSAGIPRLSLHHYPPLRGVKVRTVRDSTDKNLEPPKAQFQTTPAHVVSVIYTEERLLGLRRADLGPPFSRCQRPSGSNRI